MEHIARQDLTLFLNGCRVCTGQAGFYQGARSKQVGLDFLHAYILGNYRSLYMRSLAGGLNTHNQASVIANLLERGAPDDPQERALEGALLAATLDQMPASHAWRALSQVARRGVNNRRARAIIAEFVRTRPNLPLHALKYRRHLRRLMRHAHLRLDPETHRVVFESVRGGEPFETPLYETWRQAHYSDRQLFELPMTVAEGLAASRGINRERFLRQIRGQMTRGERSRLQRAAAAESVDLGVDLQKMPLERLARYIAGMSVAERRDRRAGLEAALRESARHLANSMTLELPRRAALVLDVSYSTLGSRQRRRSALALALALPYLVEALGASATLHWTCAPSHSSPALAMPRGQTNLARPLLEALERRPELIFVVSDGHENDPPGGLSAVWRAFKRDLDPGDDVELVHLNPVFDAEWLEPRRLDPEVCALGMRAPQDLGLAMMLSRFARGRLDLGDLTDYLETRAARLIDECAYAQAA